MAKTNGIDKTTPKKFYRQLLEETMENALFDLKPALGEKKFKRRIKKAGKIFSNGITRKALEKYKKTRENPVENNNVNGDSLMVISDTP